MTSYNRIYPLALQPFESYLPTAFDNNLSILQKVNLILKHLKEIVDQSNVVLDEFEKIRAEFEAIKEWIETEALTESVLTILNDWYATGKFAELINEAVFENYVDKELERYYISPIKLGAKGDGIQDDTQYVQLAMNMGMSAGVTVNLGNYRFKCSATLIGGSNLHITGNGANIEYNSIPKTFSNGVSVNETPAIRLAGTFNARTFLITDVAGQATSVSVGDTNGLAPGDWVQLGSEDFYQYSGKFTIPRGELKQIRTITGNTIAFTTAVYEGYKIANSAFVRKVNFVENIVIEGVDFVGSYVDQLTWNYKEIGIDLYLVKDFNIEKCKLLGQDFVGVRVRSCVNGNIDKNIIKGAFRQSNLSKGTAYYGIAIQNNSQWIYVGQNKGETLRRMGVVTASQTDYGQPYFIIFQGNQFRDSHFASSGRVEGFEHHGFGRWITFDSNQVDSALGGIRFEGKDIVCTNNIFTNIVGSGITFDADAGWFENILVANNHISEPIEDGTSSVGYGIQVETVPNNNNRNIVIRDNIIHGFASTSRSGIRVIKKAGSSTQNCIIKGNAIDSGKTVTSTDGIGILVEAIGWNVIDNDIYGYDRGIQLTAECIDNIIKENTISNPTLATGTNGSITLYGTGIKSIRNVFNKCNIAHRIISTGVNNKIHDNVYIGVTTQLSNAGTGTVETSPQVL